MTADVGRSDMTNTSRLEKVILLLKRTDLLWVCSVVGLISGAAIVWMFGVRIWTLLTMLLLVACPIVVVWVLTIERQENRGARK